MNTLDTTNLDDEPATSELRGEHLVVASGDAELDTYSVQPLKPSPTAACVVMCHGFPSGNKATFAVQGGQHDPHLADRVSTECGCRAVTFDWRGIGKSAGQFSIRGWREDLATVVDYAIETGSSSVVLVGFRTGGALSLAHAAEDERIRAVATLAAQADIRDWSTDPRRFLELSRRLQVITDPAFPGDVTSWSRQLRAFQPLDFAPQVAPRPVLILHGGDDDTTPPAHARALFEACGPRAELRIFPGAGHFLRFDPRAVAVLLGWIDRTVGSDH